MGLGPLTLTENFTDHDNVVLYRIRKLFDRPFGIQKEEKKTRRINNTTYRQYCRVL